MKTKFSSSDTAKNISFAYSPSTSDFIDSLMEFIPFGFETYKLENAEQLNSFLYNKMEPTIGIQFEDSLKVRLDQKFIDSTVWRKERKNWHFIGRFLIFGKRKQSNWEKNNILKIPKNYRSKSKISKFFLTFIWSIL